jgi:hypothetical protein
MGRLLTGGCKVMPPGAVAFMKDRANPCRREAIEAGALNVDPFPGTLDAVIVPPVSSQLRLPIERPGPVPPCFRVVDESTWKKGLKSLWMSAAAISPETLGAPLPSRKFARISKQIEQALAKPRGLHVAGSGGSQEKSTRVARRSRHAGVAGVIESHIAEPGFPE